MMDNINLLTSSAFLHLGKATRFALLSVYETSSAFDVLSASCCLSFGCIARYAPSFRTAICSILRSAIESHWLSSYSKLQEMNL